MLEDGVALGAEFLRAHGHTHLDVLDFPFSPRTTVHPDAAVLEPLGTGVLLFVDSCKDGVGTLAVGTVGVCQVAGNEYLVGLNLAEQFAYNLNILLGHGEFLYLAALIERKVKEVDVVKRYIVVSTCCTGFTTADKTLDGAHLGSIYIALLLVLECLLDVLVHLGDDLVLAVHEELVVTIDEVHEACHLLVAHGNVATGLIGHMQVVALLDKALDGTTHRDDVVVGMGREDNDALGEWLGALGAIGIVGVGLASGPSGDGVLQVIEYLDVGIVSRTIEGEQLGESVLIVVLVGELEDGLAGNLAEPYEGCAGELVGPLAAGYQPGMDDAGELAGGGKVDDHMGIVVGLEERCGNGVANLAFDHAAHNLCLLLSPCGDKHLAGSQDVGDTQGDRAWRHRLLRAEAQRHLLAADGVDEDEAGLRSEGRAGLVGSDVTHTAYAEQHHVDAAKGLDALLIEAALALHVFLGDGTVEGIDILLGNVDVAQQTLAELADGAVLAVGCEGENS